MHNEHTHTLTYTHKYCNMMVCAYLRTVIGQIKSLAKRQRLNLFEAAQVFGYHFAQINMLIRTIQ